MVLYQKALIAATTEAEKQLATAFFNGGGAIKNMDEKTSEIAIKNILGMWAVAVGPNQIPTNEEWGFIYNFIKKNYGFLTIKELSLCMELAITGELDEPARLYNGMFSVEYCSRILNSYRRYRNEQLKKIDENQQRFILENTLDYKPDPKTEAEIMKEIVRNEYQMYKTSGRILDFSDIIYNYLKSNNLLRFVTKKLRDEALNHGEMKAVEVFKAKRDTIKSIGQVMDTSFVYRDQTEARNKFARGFILRKFFDTLDLEKFLKGILPKQFEIKR